MTSAAALAPPVLGIPPLDGLLRPVPRGAALLLENDPGVSAEAFLYQAAHEHLARGHRVVYLVADRAPSTVLDGMAQLGYDDRAVGGGLSFVDAFSGLVGLDEGARFGVKDPMNPAQVVEALERAAREEPEGVLLVDSLSALVDRFGPPAFLHVAPRLVQAIKRFPVSATLFTRWPYGGGVERTLDAFDALLGLRGVQDRVLFGQYFTVERAAWKGDRDGRPRLYRVDKPGGIHVYIPKLVVTGPYGGGKSTFIRTVSDSAVSVNRLGTTVALDHGHVTVDGIAADLFGTPGQPRFDPILRTVAGNALGIIVVVDASQPETMDRARAMIDLVRSENVPIMVAANKQDAAGALSPEQVAAHLDLPPGVEVVGCVATEKDTCLAVLRRLVDRVTGGPLLAPAGGAP